MRVLHLVVVEDIRVGEQHHAFPQPVARNECLLDREHAVVDPGDRQILKKHFVHGNLLLFLLFVAVLLPYVQSGIIRYFVLRVAVTDAVDRLAFRLIAEDLLDVGQRGGVFYGQGILQLV